MAEFKLGRIRFVWKNEWVTGTTYYKDDVIRFGGKVYICQAGHTASLDFNTDLDISPSKWNLMSDGQRWTGDWTTAYTYEEGDLVKYGGTIYVCTNGHTSAATTALGLENNFPADWDEFVEGFEWKGSWTISTRYKVNDIVKYGGINYVCTSGHTSAATTTLGLETNADKWQVFSQGQEYTGNWNTGVRYKLNDIVKWGAGLWICTSHHTSTTFPSDVSSWSQYVDGFEFEDIWNSATAYQPGDVVKYGGNQYVSKTLHTNSNPLTGTSNWDLFSEGLKYEASWSNSSSYKIGEVVTLNGYNYLAIADSPSVALTVTSVVGATDHFVTSDTTGLVAGMSIRFSGTTIGGVMSGARYYVKQVINGTDFTITDIYGGSQFNAIVGTGTMPAVASAEPPNTSYWTTISTGMYWRGVWTDDVEYNIGDTVRFNASSYICKLSHRSEGDDGSTIGTAGGGQANSRPDLDISGTYWDLVVAGSELSVLSTVGDMVYYGGAGPTRLPIGTEGQVLRVSSNGTPEWSTWGRVDHVYYVAPTGGDRPYPDCGSSLDAPWASIRYACTQVEEGARNPEARYLLEINRVFIQREVTSWIRYQISTATIGSIWYNFDYDEHKCERDVGFVVDRIIWDITHGGNLKTLAAALTYINALSSADLYATAEEDNGTGTYSKISTEGDNDVAAFNYMQTVIHSVLANEAPGTVYQNILNDSTAIVTQHIDTAYIAEAGVVTEVDNLIGIITTALNDGVATNLPARLVPSNTIFVKTGNYTEVLPIIVPAETALVGDEVRSVHVAPAGELIGIEDSYYTIRTLERLETVFSQLIQGTTVTKSSGNTKTQSADWPFSNSSVATSTTAKLRAIKYNTDFRVGTIHSFSYPDPTGYNVSYLAGYGDARTLVLRNKLFVKEQVEGWLTANYPELYYSRTACKRDVGYIVDALIYDLSYGGNVMSCQAGLAYYQGTGSGLYIDSTEKAATLAAYGYLKTLLQNIATNTLVTLLQSVKPQIRDLTLTGGSSATTFIGNCIDEMIDIVTNGPTAETRTNPATTWVAGTLTTASTTLSSAKATIQSNTISWINSNYPTLTYDSAKCSRDVGYMIDAVRYDFMFDSNFQTLKAAYSYLRATASEIFSLGQKAATRAAWEYVRTQAIANVGGDSTAISRINALFLAVDDIIYSGSNEGNVCQSEDRMVDYAILQLERNRDFIVAEVTAWMAATYPFSSSNYFYEVDACERDVHRYIDSIKWDLKYSSNYKSLLGARYYANAMIANDEEDMFYLRNGTGVRNMTLEGLNGDLTAENAYGTRRVTAGAYASLDPGWGPDDFRTWIVHRSPYVQNCCTFGNAAIGQKIDGSLHNGGNKSIVSNDFTQIISDGIGAWVTNNARAELVSVFTYYSHVGYLAENGGRIRGTNGNNSYGDFGSVAEGYDANETPIYAIVDNKAYRASVGDILTDGIDYLWQFEFNNAGTDYTELEWTVAGGGTGASVKQDDFRDSAVYQVRLLDNVDDSTNAPEASGNYGGYGYVSNANTAQAGTTSAITIAAVDDEITGAYVGMKIIVTAGTGAGQVGIIDSYTSGTKVATVTKESTGAAGWDHIVMGTPIVAPDASSTYVIEPALSFTSPTYSSTARTLATAQTYSEAVYAPTFAIYTPVTGTTGGSGINASFTVVRKGIKYYDIKVYAAGTKYARLDTITIVGTSLGGATTTNDITITITAVNASTGAIEDFEYTGVGAGGKFVAISSGSRTTNTSVNGTSWSENLLSLPSTSTWRSMASGKLTVVESAGAFVTGRAYVITSLGNTLWTSIGASTQLVGTYFIATGNGGATTGTATPVANHLVAISGSTTVNSYSTDGGVTWTSGGALPGGISGTAVDIAYGLNGSTGTWVVIGSSGATAYSTNGGVTWTSGGALPSGTWQAVAYGQGRWIAISTGGTTSAYSTNGGSTWTAGGSLGTSTTWIDIEYGANKFVAVSSDGAVSPVYSVNGGVTWYNTGVAGWLNQTVTHVRYGQGVFVATNSTSNNMASSQDGINWTTRAITRASGTGALRAVPGNPNQSLIWAIIPSASTTAASSAVLGATAKGRAYVADNKIYAIRITDPGSAYASAPTLTITDPNNLYEAPTTVRIGNGACANPSFVNRGLGFDSAFAEQDTGDGYADNYQDGQFMAVKRLTGIPEAGANVVFSTQPTTVYKLVQVLSTAGEFDGGKTAFLQISPDMSVYNSPVHETGVTTRILYSQVRLTGHDFLNVGTGNFVETNYPGEPTQIVNQLNETVDNNGGRVFYTSTDQDGNFRVGELFTIEQSTGKATLNADAFNIAGLSELSLGNITLGGNSATITEFSTDPFLTANSDNVVPTQRAIKAYIAAQIGGGGASLNVNSIVAGFIEIAGTHIGTTTGGTIQMKANFNFQAGVRGLPVAWNYFLNN